MKKTILSALLFLIGSMAMNAQDAAMPFCRIERDPAALAMGGAGYLSGGAFSSMRNSAAIPFNSERFSFTAGWQNYAPSGEKSSNLSGGVTLKAMDNLGFSLGFVRQGGTAYNTYSSSGVKVGVFSPSEMIISGGAGYRLGNLGVGANVRYINSSLADDNAVSALAADLSAFYSFGEVSVSAGVSSIGSQVTASDKKTYGLPGSFTLGAVYAKSFAEKHGIRAETDMDIFFSGGVAAALGFEYCYGQMVFARAGYHYGSATSIIPSYVSAGLGAKFAGVRADLAYLLGNEILEGTLAISLGYSF